jgi:asparagine synthase (glutamine-hydrolysing)
VGEQLAARRGGLERLPSLSQVSAAEYLGYTQHTLLKDTDQMSMAVSLEVREPFFDLDLVEFVLAVPDRLKKNDTPGNGTRKNGTPKSLLVESLYPMLPDKIVYRKKQGFLLPWELWLRKDLRDFCARRLNNMAQREFVHGAELMDRWRRFLREDADVRWAEIWLFVVLDFWLDHNDVT